MKRILWVVFIFTLNMCLYAQSNFKVNEILEKNIQAGGGKENLKLIKNYSFKLGSKTYYISCDGRMKITEGKEPVVTEVVLIDEISVKRNSFNKITEFKGFEKALYQCLAKLYSGVFTLTKFRHQLTYEGLKKFGPEKHYCLTLKTEDIKVNFYIDSEEFTIKRIVFQGHENGEKIEINYDFGPFQEIDGIKIPSSWFRSKVGARGTMYEVSDVKINQNLPDEFLKKLDVNIGEIEISEGVLKGDIIDFIFSRGMLLISTNWTKECFLKAGFKQGEKLFLQINNENIEIIFYDSEPPRGAVGPGSKFLMPNLKMENFLIYLWSQEFQSLAEKLSIFSPIKLKRK